MFNALAASSQELKNSAWTGVLDKSTGRKRDGDSATMTHLYYFTSPTLTHSLSEADALQSKE